jgi:hypothetical protein
MVGVKKLRWQVGGADANFFRQRYILIRDGDAFIIIRTRAKIKFIQEEYVRSYSQYKYPVGK